MNENTGSDSGAGPPHHRLTVTAVREETAEARSFVLVPEPGDETLYRYRPGQFLSFRVPHDGGELIRSYSLSSAPGTDPDMTVCVKRVAGGSGRFILSSRSLNLKTWSRRKASLGPFRIEILTLCLLRTPSALVDRI